MRKKRCSWESVRFHQESPLKLSKQLSSFKVLRPALKLFYICAHVHSIFKRHQRGYLQYPYLGAIHETTRFIQPRFPLFGTTPRHTSISLFPLPRSLRLLLVVYTSYNIFSYFQRLCCHFTVNVSGFHCSLAPLVLLLFQETSIVPSDGFRARMLWFKGPCIDRQCALRAAPPACIYPGPSTN
jgi:hypothetical protein